MKQEINGWIILDKPTGITSAHAVAKVKWLLSRHPVRSVAEAQDLSIMDKDPAQRLRRSQDDKIKIGHAGTLDPLASGILPLALGEATKTVPYLVDADKEYAFSVSWGQERSTDDMEGEVVASSDKRPSEAEILAILPDFIGEIEQIPPIYSAIKLDGKRAYDMARSGEEVNLVARRIQVHDLKMVSYTADKSDFICRCGKGTYIRSIGRDMGRKLGCFGHISALRRLRVGPHGEAHAISLAKLEEMVHKGLGFLESVESALDDIPALDITSSQAVLLKRGQTFSIPQATSCEAVLARCEGKLIAICSLLNGTMKPVRVFNLP